MPLFAGKTNRRHLGPRGIFPYPGTIRGIDGGQKMETVLGKKTQSLVFFLHARKMNLSKTRMKLSIYEREAKMIKNGFKDLLTYSKCIVR